jgi:pimeloyl-ACP methyl ester carboxylesterase
MRRMSRFGRQGQSHRRRPNSRHEVVVPNAGHWLMEEAPAATIAAVRDFLAAH